MSTRKKRDRKDLISAFPPFEIWTPANKMKGKHYTSSINRRRAARKTPNHRLNPLTWKTGYQICITRACSGEESKHLCLSMPCQCRAWGRFDRFDKFFDKNFHSLELTEHTTRHRNGGKKWFIVDTADDTSV